MSHQPHFSVVVPVHNEADYLASAAQELAEELDRLQVPWEVLLVENGSTDQTALVAEAVAGRLPGFRLLRLPLPDYGAAMRAGFEAGRAPWLVNFDIDYFSGEFLAEVLATEERADLVLASKLAPGARDRRSLLRRFGTRVFNLLLRLLFRSRISDTHGMKAVRREVIERIVPQVEATRDLFDTELVIRAERAGYRIVELPARVEERRLARSRFLSRVPRTILGMVRMRGRLEASGSRGRR